jgi:hypothetical protein
LVTCDILPAIQAIDKGELDEYEWDGKWMKSDEILDEQRD